MTTRTIHSLPILNFSPSEFVSMKDPFQDQTPFPDWNIHEDLVHCLQWLRNRVGVIKITSGFRSLEYNRSIGSRYTSRHPMGRAVDIATPSLLFREQLLYYIGQYNSVFLSRPIHGIGVAPKKKFVHIDNDPARKNPVFWTY